MRPLIIFLLIFITFCTNVESHLFEIESMEGSDLISTRISIDVEQNRNGNVIVSIQAFPKKVDEIKNYKLIFDMKFREDYEGDFLGVCVGPSWKDFGPGEFSVILNNNNNFKNSIVGKFLDDNDGLHHISLGFSLFVSAFLIGLMYIYTFPSMIAPVYDYFYMLHIPFLGNEYRNPLRGKNSFFRGESPESCDGS